MGRKSQGSFKSSKKELVLSRKKRRKQARIAKKQSKWVFQNAASSSSTMPKLKQELPMQQRKKKTSTEGTKASSEGTGRKREREALSQAMPSIKKKVGEKGAVSFQKDFPQNAAHEKDKEEIAKLEKLLNVDKKKRLPSAFQQDGLNCILFVWWVCVCVGGGGIGVVTGV